MTTKGEAQETSEFLRRRQLRLQQVREQSKDIAKKIRQRAKVEKLRQVVDLDDRKERDYKQSQERVVKKLEELYSRGLNNVGSSHKQARGLTQPVNVSEKVDPSHLRGREAVAELKRQKQQKLDELKKALDRKLQAREAANELSREKTAYTANKLSKPSSKTNIVNEETKATSENVNGDLNLINKDLPEKVSRTDMGTQWDIDLLPPEWEPNVPALALSQEDDIKESAGNKDNVTDKQKKTDLFALSDEMPTSLRGGSAKPSDTGPSKFSSTLVSEYIQNRVLRLRETEVSTSKQQSEDLKNLRQTISRSRPLRSTVHDKGLVRGKESDNVITKKKSVTTYNHSTRDTRDVPPVNEPVVYRDRSSEQDAYSQALSESMSACNHDTHKTSQQSVNKVAVTKQNVEKEYKDTIAFLNSLPKNKNTKPINNAYKDDHRLQAQRDNRQRILQQEFRNIEEESRRQNSQGYKSKSRLQDKSPSRQTKSSADSNVDNNLNERDFCYSWMPVPDSDSKLAVHTIPTGHSVKFSVDSYHEYRSRHKHTPPTKDTARHHTPAGRKLVQTLIVQKDDDCSSDESDASEESSTDAHPPHSDPKQNVNDDDSPKRRELTDTERVIIYKILNHKHRKKNKAAKVNSTSDVNRDNEGTKVTQDEKVKQSPSEEVASKDEYDEHARGDRDPLGFDHLTEGVYEVAGKNKDNLESMYLSRLDNYQSSSSDKKCGELTQGSSSGRTNAGEVPLQARKKCSSAKCKGHNPKSQATLEASPSASVEAAATAVTSAQDAGLVKLIDDVQKQGNFYIGATGFLKNDAYEVIIQLRKNDTTKEVVKTQDVPGEILKPDIRNENTKITKCQVVPPLEQKDYVQQKELIDDSNPSLATVPPPPVTDQVSGANPTDIERQPLSKAVSEDVQSMKTTQDRSVSTSFNELIPESIAKSEPIARPATSTCTQTTPSPSNPRPVYIHMSSSTSTAYMSPPEVVLPHFFKRGDKPCRKARRSARNNEKKGDSNFIRHEHHCKSYSSCKIFEKMASKPKIDRLNFYADIYSEKNEFAPSSSLRNYNCSKCNTRGASELCYKHHIRNKVKHHLNAAKQNTCTCNSKNGVVHSKMNKSRHASILSSKSYLSPLIKQYIHKLLSLNREGIKAIQIMNQDCSSVNTPASSIINMPTNFSTNNFQRSQLGHGSRDWEQFESILKQRVVLHNNATHAMFSRPDNATMSKYKIPKNIKPRIRNSKNKRVHKVKSLNISKRIVVKATNVSSKAKDDNYAKKLLSNVASSDRDSTPSDHIKSYDKSSNKNNNLDNRTASKTIQKRPLNQYIEDTFSPGLTKAASNSNINNEITSKPINISTQTSCPVDGEINFIKLAEGKLQNMEKIADLTEKCTKRLSNLAKVLEEVRKNKSIAYSQVSTTDSTSDSDQKSDKTSEKSDLKNSLNTRERTVKSSKNLFNIDSTDYESLTSGVQQSGNIGTSRVKTLDNDFYENSNTDCISQSVSTVSTNDDFRESNNTKCRNRPPPALLRMNLKHPQDIVVPHELSTVMEVDSPLSVKFKQQSPINTHFNNNLANLNNDENGTKERQLLPELSLNMVNKSSKEKNKVMFRDSLEDSKLQMMDLNQFNEIMLRPFVSLQEYAQDHYDRSTHTVRENVSKDGITDDISSLHSDGSLPDVVAELLKRKLITEPFRFDTASNMNSTTISSESTLSVLALSKVKKDKTKSKLTANKENVGETSDSLSISSNPDLENAFKKLGMGWASSTLKKTKERLALSSSSNTSSSSLSQLKLKNSTKQDEAVVAAAWSVSNISKKPVLKRRLDTSINVGQQTSFANNMTVKEFLTKELAKKITFTDKSNRNDTNQEFVSLYETKLPDNFKNSSHNVLDDHSGDSAPSGNNNRARTSTPVKLFKSVTYHSSSSSNISNGLFSNADELSSVKLTPASVRHQSASQKDELTVPNCSLKMRKSLSDCSKTDSC